jgi:hypothetical protein
MNEFWAREFWRFVMLQQCVIAVGASSDPISADAGTSVV